MAVDAIGIEEVVTVGYGTMRKKDLTGSVIRADIDNLREMPNVNIAQSLQGTVPGLYVGAVDEAGENPAMAIRGATTISGNQNVLIVVDGIIFNGGLSFLNPNDIESVDILKDASSMAIYGAQAANGVILVTTKMGKTSAKPVFNYSGSYTTQTPSNELSPMNKEQYMQKLLDNNWEQAYLAPDYTTPNPDFDVLDIGLFPIIREGIENGYEYNWWDNATNPGFINTHNLSVTGKSNAMSYFISGGYTDQKGFIINDKFQRITSRINLTFEILKWFRLGTQSFFSTADYSGESPNLTGIAFMSPVSRPYDNNGNLIIGPNGDNIPNPYISTLADDFDNRYNLFANFFADIDIPFIKGLNYRLNYANTLNWNRNYSSNVYTGTTTAGRANKNVNFRNEWTLDNIVNYKKRLGEEHEIDFTLVAGRREIYYENTAATGSNYNNLRLSYNDLSLAEIQLINSSAWDESYLYQSARLNYNFASKYFLTTTIRRDGFSGFAENKKTALFPSVGLGWVISEESLLKNDFLNYLKLRGSYGSNGNLVGRYSSLAVLDSYPAYVFGDGGATLFGQKVTKLGNPDLGWESTAGFNFGFDFGIINSRVSGNVDYYSTVTNDLIFDVAIPSITGFNTITTNVGELRNKGFEFSLNSKIIDKTLKWDMNFNFSTNNNKIVSLIGMDSDGDGTEDDLIASGLFIGESINTIYGYESDGRYQVGDTDIPAGFTVGTDKIIDQNNDGFIDPLDRVIRGKEEPAYRFGMMNEFKFGQFALRFFINSIQGGKNGYRLQNIPGIGNQESLNRRNNWAEIDYWTPSNPDSRYPALNKTAATTFLYLGNRSFVRLQDVSLSYNISSRIIQKIGIQNCKIYTSGKNLLTLTNWEGWDPETGYGIGDGGRPVLKGYTLGIDFSF
jgi:TonB-linked SusC/RagA family outer membrane protein